jgi:hypothetical protein
MATTRSLEVQASTNKMCNNNNRLCKETMALLNLLDKFRPTPMSKCKLRSSSFQISLGNRAKTPLRHSNSWPALTSVKSPTRGTTSLHFHTSGWRSVVRPTNGSAQSSAICTSQLPKKHGPASGGLIQASFQSRICCFLRRQTYHRWTRQTFTQVKQKSTNVFLTSGRTDFCSQRKLCFLPSQTRTSTATSPRRLHRGQFDQVCL